MDLVASTIFTQAGMNGVERVTGTGSAASTSFTGVYALANTVIATLTGPGLIGTWTAVPLQANGFIGGQFTALTLTSGDVYVTKGAVNPA